MFEQAAGLALVGAFYPPALLIAGLYLASTRSGRITVVYVIGGLVIVTIVGTAALLAIRVTGLSLPTHQHTRYGLRLALGVVAIAAAVLIYRRKPKKRDPVTAGSAAAGSARAGPVTAGSARAGSAAAGPVTAGSAAADPARGGSARAGPPAAGPAKVKKAKKAKKAKKPSLIDRLSAEPRPMKAFLAGIVMFGPSLTFLAAVQVVATAKASLAATLGAMAMIIVLTLAFAWLPLVAYLIAPDLTVRKLKAGEAWLRRHGKVVLVAAVGLIGVLLVIQGIVGLV